MKSKTTADFSRFRRDPDNMSLDNVPASAPALPDVSENPENDADSPAQKPSRQEVETPPKPSDVDAKQVGDATIEAENPSPPSSTALAQEEPVVEPTHKPPVSSSLWLGGWFGRPVSQPPPIESTEPKPDGDPGPAESKPDDPEPDSVGTDVEPPKPAEPEETVPAPEPPSEVEPQGKVATAGGGYWFGFWPGSNASSAPAPATPAPPAPPATEGDTASAAAVVEEPIQTAQLQEDVVMEDAPPQDSASTPAPAPAPAPKAGSTWAFWSRDTSSSASASKKKAPSEEPGELAVIGESSETHPKRANSMEFKAAPVKEPPLQSAKKEDQVKESPSKKNKRARPLSMGVDEITDSRPATPKPEPPAKAEPIPKAGTSKTPAAVKSSVPNLILPSFKNTYRQKENPSIVQQIAQLLLRSHQAPTKHVFLTKDQPKIKKALAIGVHGLYPATYLRSVIGQPTGTSIKFANHSAEAIRRWADSHGCEDCEIEKVALEGEGRIGERVENLWRLLLNWIDHIRKADLIIIGCHSQGVPVSIILLAKLIELGIITTAKVGICAMGKPKNPL